MEGSFQYAVDVFIVMRDMISW